MQRTSLVPSTIVATALIVSSLILLYGMHRLGANIVAAGIHSRKISVEHSASYGRPIRVVLDEDSELQLHTDDRAVE